MMTNKFDLSQIIKEQIKNKTKFLSTNYYNYYLRGLLSWNEYYWLVYNLKGRY